jgi:hypothetical protein
VDVFICDEWIGQETIQPVNCQVISYPKSVIREGFEWNLVDRFLVYDNQKFLYLSVLDNRTIETTGIHQSSRDFG